MGKIKQAMQKMHDKVVGRPMPNTPKAGYTSDGRRYGKGGKIKKKQV